MIYQQVYGTGNPIFKISWLYCLALFKSCHKENHRIFLTLQHPSRYTAHFRSDFVVTTYGGNWFIASGCVVIVSAWWPSYQKQVEMTEGRKWLNITHPGSSLQAPWPELNPSRAANSLGLIISNERVTYSGIIITLQTDSSWQPGKCNVVKVMHSAVVACYMLR